MRSQIPSSVTPLSEISFKLPIYRFITPGHPYSNSSLSLLHAEVQNEFMKAKILA